MTYRVDFHAAAFAQLDGLPSEAFDALVDHVVKLVDAPWDAQLLSPDEPQFRQSQFGGSGLISFHLDDHRRLLRIFDVTWVG
ncbi:hypothetical protein [Kribbella sp. CA-293567]|uniref:hypothetical protein n=1 Tax=Kribbella sp. CA-293567 TaxID=3002436 RepID=UPI0022DD092A|nr:hypothetical protein [Kribbella sp. CA-293567]WBQ04840.1 hypothetical protein OX958_33405 [Kribbella sp. CA-293567]